VAQHCSLAAGENRCHFFCERWEERVSNQVHASMDGMKPLPADRVLDRLTADPSGEQLGTCYETVLHGRHLRDGGIARQLGQTATKPERGDGGCSSPP
jgi:hypothetical protein